MSDAAFAAPAVTPPAIPPGLLKIAAEFAARPTFPTSSEVGTLHLGLAELPWAEAGDGSAIQLLHVDLNSGLWISNVRMPPGYRVATHFHTGHVYAVTHQGRWHYAESPEQVNSAGSYLFEPANSVHTLCTAADQTEPTIVWFAVHGSNVNLDAEGKPLNVMDARTALWLYRGWCEAFGLDCSRLIVVGE